MDKEFFLSLPFFERAMALASVKHAGQFDKAGKPYIMHVIRVMEGVDHDEEKVMALLHDLIEDTDFTLEDLKDFAFPPKVIEGVRLLTREKGRDYMDYIEELSKDQHARNVKLSDLKDNQDKTRLKDPMTKEDYDRLEKYTKAETYLRRIMEEEDEENSKHHGTSKTNRPLNVGIIGCGDVTEVKSGPAFQKLPDSNLTFVMRRNEEKLKDYAHRHQVKKYSTDYKDLLNDDEVDLVYIATPPNMHKFYTLEAARAKKHVYVEKPMAMTVEEGQEMVDVCKKEGVKLFVAYYRRGQEKFEAVRTILESEQIGEIRSFQMLYTSKVPKFNAERPWLYDKEIAGGGKLYDIGSHMIDILLYLFGEVSYAKGLSANQSQAYDVEDVTSGLIQFKSGVQGTVQFNFNGLESNDRLLIIGSKGSIALSVMDMEDVLVNFEADGEEIHFFPNLDHVQQPFIEKVLKTIKGEDLDYPIDDTGTYGLRTQEILETFRDSKEIVY